MLWHRAPLANVGLVYCKVRYIATTKHLKPGAMPYAKRSLPCGWVLDELLAGENFIGLSATMIRKDYFVQVGGVPNTYRQMEDLYLFAAICAISPVLGVEHTDCLATVHGQNLSFKQRTIGVIENLEIIDKFKTYLDKNAQTACERRIAHLQCRKVIFGLYEGHGLDVRALKDVGLKGAWFIMGWLYLAVARRMTNALRG